MTDLTADRARLVEALTDMVGLAEGGAARAHLDQAGVMQDPPHGWGKYAECEAPWCVRNQKRIADARAALARPGAAAGDALSLELLWGLAWFLLILLMGLLLALVALLLTRD